MTAAERVQAVADYDFSERQARFLVLVMRHSGLCVKRQYAAFAGIANGGEKCNAFFRKLVRRGFAIESACIHNRARLYHVNAKPLYHAIGEPDSRYRRTVPARAAGDRLMRLDAALISPDLEWLTTRVEKLAYAKSRTVLGVPEPSSAVAFGNAANQLTELAGTFPIGIDSSGRLVLLFLATNPWTDDFRTFLIGHAPLLSLTRTWTLRVVFPQSLRRAVAAYEAVVREEFESPLGGEARRELQHYFFHRRRGTDVATLPEALHTRLTRYSEVYSGPRFTHLYRRWRADEQAAFTPLPSAVPAAIAEGRAAVECVVLPHLYDHLAPLVDGERFHRQRHTADAEEGEEAPHGINPSLNPAP